MKRIKAAVNQKDRVVCVTVPGAHEFYYQPVGSKERILLFVTDDFSGSVFAYFRDKGRNINDRGFSLTIKEIYEFKKFHNVRLTRVINRIPVMVEYVLRERTEEKKAVKNGIAAHEQAVGRPDCEVQELAA